MQIKIDRIRNNLLHLFCLMLVMPFWLHAGEILYEHQWTRILSGDEATRLTREIEDTCLPTEISTKVFQHICQTMGLPEQNLLQLKAWQKGLQDWGWAQVETEPERTPYQASQFLVSDKSPNRILAKRYSLQGLIQEASFALNGELVESKPMDVPQILDRTVFYTVLSPALFVLNQEHFQKQFFEEMLNLDYPGLEAAKKAYAERKTLLAAHEVAEYFRRKRHPVWSSTSPQKLAKVNQAAEKVLRHEFDYRDSTIAKGERIDYQHNPTQDSEWIWGLNRMAHWVTLLAGYRQTGNDAYAKEFNLQVIDWTLRNPAPPFSLTRVPSWRNLEAGVRMASTWPQTFFGFLRSAHFQTQAIQLMLASAWSHGEYILRFPSGLRFVNNWAIIDSNGLAVLGMSFPEFRQAPVWADSGLQRLSNQLHLQVYPDGMQHELACSYHLACLNSFYQAFNIAGKTVSAVPDNFRTTLEKMFEYVLYISTPKRQVPPTNDSNRNDIKEWMRIGADLFDRKDMQFVATNGREGLQPAKTSVQFPWGGQYVMRHGWDEQALYLFFDSGPTGVSHQHEDKLHFDVSAYGRDFLTDGGKGLYIPDQWRDYFVSSQAHNVILIDGHGQNRIADPLTHRSERAQQRSWISNSLLDFAIGSYENGFGPNRVAVTHSRYVLFKKPEYWLILDVLSGNGRHAFESLCHFMPCEVEVDNGRLAVRTRYRDGRNVQLSYLAATPVLLDVVKGRQYPPQGWIDEGGERTAAPTAILKGEGKLPVEIITFIEAVPNDSFTVLTLAKGKTSKGQAQILIKTAQGQDEWLFNLNRENRLTEAGKTEEVCLRFKRSRWGRITEQQSFKMEE